MKYFEYLMVVVAMGFGLVVILNIIFLVCMFLGMGIANIIASILKKDVKPPVAYIFSRCIFIISSLDI